MEAKLKHLGMVQDVVNRMASNSFLLKGWSLTLTSALIALSVNNENPLFVMVALVPCLMFWGLNGYFLRQERLLRRLYDEVRARQPEEIDFSMKWSRDAEEKEASWLGVCFSGTLLAFHGVIMLLVFLTVLSLIFIGR